MSLNWGETVQMRSMASTAAALPVATFDTLLETPVGGPCLALARPIQTSETAPIATISA
jgi:hypothetical protein